MNAQQEQACLEAFEAYCRKRGIDLNSTHALEDIWPTWYNAWRAAIQLKLAA